MVNVLCAGSVRRAVVSAKERLVAYSSRGDMSCGTDFEAAKRYLEGCTYLVGSSQADADKILLSRQTGLRIFHPQKILDRRSRNPASLPSSAIMSVSSHHGTI